MKLFFGKIVLQDNFGEEIIRFRNAQADDVGGEGIYHFEANLICISMDSTPWQ